MLVDILIATACKGGVENIIKMMIEDLESNDIQFRVVQLVWEGDRWLKEEVLYYPLLKGKGNYSLDTFKEAYEGFIREKNAPDVVLATVWPYTVYVAKKALEGVMGTDNNVRVFSWMHHEMNEYKKTFNNVEEWLSMADGHFAINRANYDALKDLFNVPVYRLRNPIDMSGCRDFVMRREQINFKNKNQFSIAYVGRVSREKNLELIIAALSLVEGFKLIIIGSAEDNDYENELHRLAKEIGVEERIIWKGWQSDPWSYAEECDAVCLPSLYEGFPLTALEALAHGIPVIASRTTGIGEIIEEGVTGYTFDVGDLASLTGLLYDMAQNGTSELNPQACYDSVVPFERHSALGEMRDILLRL